VEQGPSGPTLEDRLTLLAARIAESPHNLVSAGDREDVLGRHVRECVALAAVLDIGASAAWADVGTGGGLPGLVLALARPDTSWLLVDATRKKVEAVQGFAAELDLENVEVVHGRAEKLAHEERFREAFDGAISRAVGALPVVMELCRGFVRPGGWLAAVRGRTSPEELEEARAAARMLRLTGIHSARVASEVRATEVVTMRADGPAPPQFPRRDGIPRSKPLGGACST
jgi:16S rRNA (guanine527-N7)-methyltransferase